MTKRAILLNALASTPADVARLLRGLDETSAVWRASGGWSCQDVVAHMAHTEPLYLDHLQRIVAVDEPTVAALLPNVHDLTLPIAVSLQRFGEARRVMCEWLREISPAAWQRPGIHETNGRTTLRFLVQDLVAHDIEHTAQLAAILGQWRAAQRPIAGQPEGGQ